MFSCQICVEYNGIGAAVHVTILVLQKHLLNLKMYQNQDVIVKYVVLVFFLLFILYTKHTLAGKFYNCHITWIQISDELLADFTKM